jgi:hypothetical protein
VAYEVDIPEVLERLRTELGAVLGQGRVHYEPAKVNPPGIWINFLTLEIKTLEGVFVSTELVLAVPSSDAKTVAGKLTELWNAVVGLYGAPDGPIRTQATIFPDTPNPRPSLVLPYLAR